MGRYYKNEVFKRTNVQKIRKRYGFLSFVRRFGDKYGKKFMDTVTKTGIDTVIQKTAEATGDLVGNKIADETTSLGKTKSKEKKR